jgi:hypothetical protein
MLIRTYEILNIACDLAIHGHKHNPKIGLRENPNEAVRVPLADQICWVPSNWNPNLCAEEYYRLMISAIRREGVIFKLVFGAEADSEVTKDSFGVVFDDHGWDSVFSSDLTKKAIEEYIKSVASQNAGQLPGHWRQLSEAGKATVTWQALLRRFVSQVSRKQKTSILRRSRRRDIFGAPGKVSIKTRRVQVVVDVSGSVSDDLLAKFFAELDSCTGHAKLDLLLWDSQYQGFFSDYKAKDWRDRITLCGGGGTNMVAALHWLDKEKGRPDCRIILTDGYCRWAEKSEVKVPTIAVISGIDNDQFRPPPWIHAVYING